VGGATRTLIGIARPMVERVFLVAVDSERILGFGAVSPAAVLLNTLYVAPDSVGQGVGTALLKALEAAARSQGATSLRLGVDTERRPILRVPWVGIASG